MAMDWPSTQKAISPASTTSRASVYLGAETGAVKYTSSPQVFALEEKGRALTMASAVIVGKVSTRISIFPMRVYGFPA